MLVFHNYIAGEYITQDINFQEGSCPLMAYCCAYPEYLKTQRVSVVIYFACFEPFNIGILPHFMLTFQLGYSTLTAQLKGYSFNHL